MYTLAHPAILAANCPWKWTLL